MDWDKIEQLLNISKATLEHGANYTSIFAAAQLELQEHVGVAKKLVDDKYKARAEEAGRQKAEAANKAREAEEKAHADIQAHAEEQARIAAEKKAEEEAKAAAEAEAKEQADAKARADRIAKLESDSAAAATAGNVGDATVARRV